MCCTAHCLPVRLHTFRCVQHQVVVLFDLRYGSVVGPEEHLDGKVRIELLVVPIFVGFVKLGEKRAVNDVFPNTKRMAGTSNFSNLI